MLKKTIITLLSIMTLTLNSQTSVDNSIHQFKVADIYGNIFDFSQLKGKKVMIVNTASKCGYSYQYEGLEKLYSEKKDQGFVVLGFPSHDFYQEPAPEKDIKDFCNLTYDVKFPMFTKVNVRGEKAHPFYKNLATETNSSPKWNFWKYLINKEGEVVKSYSMVTSPKGDKLISMIDKLLAE